MAGHARYTAILDACVLFPPAVADALISLHVAGLYTARWTHRIDTEWINAASRDHQQLKEKLTIRRDAMRVAVVDWEVTAESYESLIVGREGVRCYLSKINAFRTISNLIHHKIHHKQRAWATLR